MSLSKKQKAAKQEIELEPNVRLLNSGAWGYVYEGKAIFRSADVLKVNLFSDWVKSYLESTYQWRFKEKRGKEIKKEILETAKEWQKLEGEPKILPQVFEQVHWRGGDGNNFESQIKIPKG